MGGDTSPENLFEGVCQAATACDATFVLFATSEIIPRLAIPNPAKMIFVPTQEAILMSDEPILAVRHKKGSSLVVGIRALKKRQIDAFVSVGNTGALLAAATLSIPLLPGIKRPALLATLPTEKGNVAVIDVGGSVASKAHNLVQFAHMGAAYQRCYQGSASPRVGLLNIGVESQKGKQEVRQAYQLLQSQAPSGMTFIGNIEAREVLQGNVDVLVTDGFSGNVLLKSIEGTSSFILHYLMERIQGLSQQPSLKELLTLFSTDEYPGAILCGVEGVVVKCHGNSSPRAFFQGIQGAMTLVKKELVHQIKLFL